MPFIKIHVPEGFNSITKRLLAADIRDCLADALSIKKEDGHVVLYESAKGCRAIHESRNPRFVDVEIILFSGRTDEIKQKLYSAVTSIVMKHTGLEEKDVLIVLIESPRNNWALGNTMLSQANLGY